MSLDLLNQNRPLRDALRFHCFERTGPDEQRQDCCAYEPDASS